MHINQTGDRERGAGRGGVRERGEGGEEREGKVHAEKSKSVIVVKPFYFFCLFRYSFSISMFLSFSLSPLSLSHLCLSLCLFLSIYLSIFFLSITYLFTVYHLSILSPSFSVVLSFFFHRFIFSCLIESKATTSFSFRRIYPSSEYCLWWQSQLKNHFLSRIKFRRHVKEDHTKKKERTNDLRTEGRGVREDVAVTVRLRV